MSLIKDGCNRVVDGFDGLACCCDVSWVHPHRLHDDLVDDVEFGFIVSGDVLDERLGCC